MSAGRGRGPGTHTGRAGRRAWLTCPAWLTGEARVYWERYAPEAERLGLLTLVDVPTFEALCRSYQQWRRYERLCDRTTAAQAVAKGYVDAAVANGQQFADLAAAFGFDPASRAAGLVRSAAGRDSP